MNDKKGTTNMSQLCTRVLSAVFIVLLTIAAVHSGRIPFFLYVCTIFGGIIYEWLTVANLRFCKSVAIGGAIVLFLSLVFSFSPWQVLLVVSLVGALFLGMFHTTRSSIVMLGIVYIFSGLYFLGRAYQVGGKSAVYFIFFCIWITDTAAFFTGKIFGGKKLAPKISPGKTWSGFIGGVACTVLVAPLVFKLSRWQVWMPLTAAISSHLGDLLESAAKRYFSVKDMGTLIPGHGGVADRFDSLLLVSALFGLLSCLPWTCPFPFP
jgi:phosphatidate cytidylyltransferase